MNRTEIFVTHLLETREGGILRVWGVPALLEPNNPDEWSYSLEVSGHLERLVRPVLERGLVSGEAVDLGYIKSEAPLLNTNPISEMVARAIAQSGLSKAEVARRLGVPCTLVTRWTHPRYAGHTVDTLERIARALGGTLVVNIELKDAA